MAEHTSSYRILFRDIDSMGVLYYARYLALFEMGRVEWMRDEGVRYRDLEDCEGVILPVTSASCEYHASLRYDDIAKVRTRMTKMSGARVCWGTKRWRSISQNREGKNDAGKGDSDADPGTELDGLFAGWVDVGYGSERHWSQRGNRCDLSTG